MNMDMVILLYIHMNMSGNMDMGPLHSSVVCDVSSSLETSTARMRRSSGSSCWRAWSTTSSGQQLTRRTDSHGVSRELPWSPHPLGKIRINQTCFFFMKAIWVGPLGVPSRTICICVLRWGQEYCVLRRVSPEAVLSAGKEFMATFMEQNLPNSINTVPWRTLGMWSKPW